MVKQPVDYGHKYGWEHRRLVRAAEEVGMSQKQFDAYVNSRPEKFIIQNMLRPIIFWNGFSRNNSGSRL
ncbi:GH-E family nuclease [Paralysiella testudinis]|uniref:Toxin YqcG C-terminal domain-containing protein n=1 Tax=Paralysiella testudinis TaxID=2809020 RepID=A0A892ZNT0_9NEIS|nr:hypothetical protein JQU52_14310 [Paralysiella testudinis]